MAAALIDCLVHQCHLVTIRGNSSSFVWAPQTFTFTADSTATTLRLADASSCLKQA